MGFWFFMLIMCLLTPAMMIGFGQFFMKGGPKQINDAFGYRTTRSMKKSVTVSEKVVRRLMKQDRLTVTSVRKRKYNSYKGEIPPAVLTEIKRDFHADAPDQKWLTDITEFSIPAGKVHLSPIIDRIIWSRKTSAPPLVRL